MNDDTAQSWRTFFATAAIVGIFAAAFWWTYHQGELSGRKLGFKESPAGVAEKEAQQRKVDRIFYDAAMDRAKQAMRDFDDAQADARKYAEKLSIPPPDPYAEFAVETAPKVK